MVAQKNFGKTLTVIAPVVKQANRDVAAAPQTPIGGAQANFGGPI